jgi:ethanolamine ammonia-lyase small subunit
MSDSDQIAQSSGYAPVGHEGSKVDLRALTPARVALDRTGASVTTRHALELSLAHAQARDAVHSVLGVASLMAALRERELAAVSVRSAAADRTEYLRRPDLGRTLSDASARLLAGVASEQRQPGGATVSVILADGLSALATERHAVALLDALLPLFGIASSGAPEPSAPWALTHIVVAERARVALGDEIGVSLRADVVVMLIGERPGLSSFDSLGAYITWSPRPGRTDAERNCVSNIRAEGLDYAAAAAKIAWYVIEGRRLGLTGVQIRERDLGTQPGAIGDPAGPV